MPRSMLSNAASVACCAARPSGLYRRRAVDARHREERPGTVSLRTGPPSNQVPSSGALLSRLLGEVFLLGLAQHLRQFVIAAVIGKKKTTCGSHPVRHRNLAPPARSSPANALASSARKYSPRYCPPSPRRTDIRRSSHWLRRRRDRARHGTLAHRFWGAANDFGDVVLTHTETGQVPHLLAHRISHGKCMSSHVPLLIDWDPAFGHGRRRIDRRLDASRRARYSPASVAPQHRHKGD